MRERREVIEVPPGREGGGAGRAGRSAHGEGCGNAAWVQRGRCDATSVVGCRCARETPACIAAVGFRCVRANANVERCGGVSMRARDARREHGAQDISRREHGSHSTECVRASGRVWWEHVVVCTFSPSCHCYEYDTLCESIAGPPAPMMLARRHERHFQCTGREAENGRQQSV